MKAEEFITETPYQMSGELYHYLEYSDAHFMSDGALERMYDHIGSAVLASRNVTFYLLKNKRSVLRGAIKMKKKVGEKLLDSNQIIFELEFKDSQTITKYPKNLDQSSILQVNSVAVLDKYRGSGIASYAYGLLIANGFIVVSDKDQFTDGKELWKKMARDSHAQNYKIYIINDTTGFVLDKDGNPIMYDGSNIDDADIWTSVEDQSGEHILLLAQ